MKTETIIKLKNLKDKYVNKYTIAGAGVVALALVIWMIVAIVGYYNVPEDNPRNSYMANNGFSLEYNNSTIASLTFSQSQSSLPERVDLGIIKTNNIGGEMEVLSEDCAAYLNFDGTYIYYINNSDGGKIYRMMPDGTGKEMVFDGNFYSMIYDDGYLYAYTAINRQIVRISTADFTSKVLVENGSTTNISVSGDNLYFFAMKGSERWISSVNKNGGLVKHYRECSDGYSIVSHNGYIYYLEGSTPQLHKLRMGAKRSKLVCEEMIYRFFIRDDKIYYLSNSSATDGGAFEMDMNGKNSRKICAGSMRALSLSHGQILPISLGYDSEPFIYFVEIGNGVIVKSYGMIDEEKMTQELYGNVAE